VNHFPVPVSGLTAISFVAPVIDHLHRDLAVFSGAKRCADLSRKICRTFSSNSPRNERLRADRLAFDPYQIGARGCHAMVFHCRRYPILDAFGTAMSNWNTGSARAGKSDPHSRGSSTFDSKYPRPSVLTSRFSHAFLNPDRGRLRNRKGLSCNQRSEFRGCQDYASAPTDAFGAATASPAAASRVALPPAAVVSTQTWRSSSTWATSGRPAIRGRIAPSRAASARA